MAYDAPAVEDVIADFLSDPAPLPPGINQPAREGQPDHAATERAKPVELVKPVDPGPGGDRRQYRKDIRTWNAQSAVDGSPVKQPYAERTRLRPERQTIPPAELLRIRQATAAHMREVRMQRRQAAASSTDAPSPPRTPTPTPAGTRGPKEAAG